MNISTDTGPSSHDVAQEVLAALRSSAGATSLDALFLRLFRESPASEMELLLVIARTCLESGYKVAARNWLRQIEAGAVKGSVDNLLSGIELAAQARQAPCVLFLCSELSSRHVSVVYDGVRAAYAIVELALIMRIPRARNGAWATHVHLLYAARSLLEHMLTFPASNEQTEECLALLGSVHRLLAGAQSSRGFRRQF
ncbi:hypothetical protein [Paraburkholderia oxyphila]|uniref:hypothetical protein n=1 Tax=Paraburkholderia oxyphila TaxID=614212 RepID=UPI0004856B5B|nr:hypothetical protein [Paraburkholderia oxyphila]